jgi:uncharacterized protein (TIGR02646 family)
MLRCQPSQLSAASSRFLKSRQDSVNSYVTKSEQYAEAKRLFSLKGNKCFQEIRLLLGQASPPADACVYCERDRRRDIEHVKPQRHYPSAAFDWENYILSCVYCNQNLKKDRFGVVNPQGLLIEFDRFSLPLDQIPPDGIPALINPRIENPFDFFILDIETCWLDISANDPIGIVRAEFTRSLFDLNNDVFLSLRRAAKIAFINYLEIYREKVLEGDLITAARVAAEIYNLPHPTVLAEIKRQRQELTFPENPYVVTPE